MRVFPLGTDAPLGGSAAAGSVVLRAPSGGGHTAAMTPRTPAHDPSKTRKVKTAPVETSQVAGNGAWTLPQAADLIHQGYTAAHAASASGFPEANVRAAAAKKGWAEQ